MFPRSPGNRLLELADDGARHDAAGTAAGLESVAAESRSAWHTSVPESAAEVVAVEVVEVLGHHWCHYLRLGKSHQAYCACRLPSAKAADWSVGNPIARKRTGTRSPKVG